MKRTVFINNNNSKDIFLCGILETFILSRNQTFDLLQEKEQFTKHVKHYSNEIEHRAPCWSEKAAQE